VLFHGPAEERVVDVVEQTLDVKFENPIADVYDALRSRRPYKDPWPTDTVIVYLREQSGKHFEPALVAGILNAADEFSNVRDALPD
jgi:response regulator RpfG family c-di-GMP phosphodiesterase